MKRTNSEYIMLFLLFGGLMGLLQSCFVWKSEIEWGSNFTIKEIQQSQPRLNISKSPGLFLLPFVIVTFSTGEYRIDFDIYDEKTFQGIDSVRYIITSEKHSVYSNKIIPRLFYYNKKGYVKKREKIKSSGDTIGRVSFTNRLHKLKLNKQIDSLRVDFDVFVKDNSGNCQTIKYKNCQLIKDGKRFGSFF